MRDYNNIRNIISTKFQINSKIKFDKIKLV